jgi:hypothetical protein
MSYGEPGKNTFLLTGVGGILSPVVDENTGVTQIFRQGAFNQFTPLGTYNPSTKSFTPDENAIIDGNLTDTEITALSQTSNLATISTQAQKATEVGVIAAGGTPEQATAKSSSLFSPNASNKPENDDEGKSGVSAEDQAKVEADAKTTAENTRSSFPTNLHYPETLKYEKQDVLKIEMLKYEPKPLDSSSLSGFGSRSKTDTRVIGSVYLPIPAGISDSNGVSWSDSKMTPLQTAGVDLGQAFITGGGEKAAGVAGEKVGAVGSNIKSVQSFIMNKILESAMQTENLLSRTLGVIENPNMELLFTSPQLRQFSFTYKLSSRGKAETDQIRQIIRFFKQGMTPQRTQAQLFLKAPYTFQLTYKHLNEDHKYLNKFKECALTNFSVDYTPEGQYATFKDGAMVSYQITMQFQELEPIFNDDYPQDNDASIGY